MLLTHAVNEISAAFIILQNILLSKFSKKKKKEENHGNYSTVCHLFQDMDLGILCLEPLLCGFFVLNRWTQSIKVMRKLLCFSWGFFWKEYRFESCIPLSFLFPRHACCKNSRFLREKKPERLFWTPLSPNPSLLSHSTRVSLLFEQFLSVDCF